MTRRPAPLTIRESFTLHVVKTDTDRLGASWLDNIVTRSSGQWTAAQISPALQRLKRLRMIERRGRADWIVTDYGRKQSASPARTIQEKES